MPINLGSRWGLQPQAKRSPKNPTTKGPSKTSRTAVGLPSVSGLAARWGLQAKSSSEQGSRTVKGVAKQVDPSGGKHDVGDVGLATETELQHKVRHSGAAPAVQARCARCRQPGQAKPVVVFQD